MPSSTKKQSKIDDSQVSMQSRAENADSSQAPLFQGFIKESMTFDVKQVTGGDGIESEESIDANSENMHI